METIDYYHENRSDCFLLLLDASKAFGRIDYVKLFQTPHDRKIGTTVLRLIMHMYVNQKILIRGINYCHRPVLFLIVSILYSISVDNVIRILRKK